MADGLRPTKSTTETLETPLMTDQTSSTVSILVDHVTVTDTVVARLAQCPQIQFHHGDGATSGIPRYIADEIGQAVLALVPDEPADITPEQAALLDAVRDVALSNDAMAGEYAGKQLVRLAAAAFGYPLPEPVQREGGLTGFLFGRPIVTEERATGGAVDPHRPALVGDEPWPFAPGTVVRDEDGAEAEWLQAAPHGTVVRTSNGYEWVRHAEGDRWSHEASHASSLAIANQAPVTVVRVPDQEANRG